MSEQNPPESGDDPWSKLARLPSLDDEPVEGEWMPRPDAGAAIPGAAAPDVGPADPPPSNSVYATPGRYHVPAPDQPAQQAAAPAGAVPPPATTPPPLPAPDVAPATAPRRRRSRRRRWPLRVAATLLLALLVVVGGGILLAWQTWQSVDRVAIPTLATDTSRGTNYLIVGTDSREGVATDLETAGGIFGDGSESFSGERTDTIVILRVAPDGNRFLALNRDLWVSIAGTGGEQRINTAFQGGPQRLVDTVQDSLGIPVHHYMEVDFAGFLGLVESINGIDVEVAHPAYDPKTGLNITTAGVVHLEPEQALAYVRTRNYIEVIDGQDVTDPTSDFGRVQRQQAFLEAVFNEVGGTKNPITLLRAARSLSGNVRIDDTWGFWEAANFGRRLKSLDPESIELPVFDFTGPNGEAVLGLATEAEVIIAGFR